MGLGLVDASVVAVADRLGITTLATLGCFEGEQRSATLPTNFALSHEGGERLSRQHYALFGGF